MSHMTPVTWSPNNLDTLLDIARELGFEILHGTRARFYNGQSKECDVCLRLSGSDFDIAVSEFAGRYRLEHDAYSEHGRKLTKAVRSMHTEYVIRTQTAVAAKNGYRVTRQKNARGQTQLVATRRAV